MKRITAFLLVLAVAFSTLVFYSTPSAYAESLFIRKIVSVVYDDSGSMRGEKWAYANYAMQAFCGMLNNEDKLFISYMSGIDNDPNYEPEEIDLSGDGIQASLDGIRKHTTVASTPFGAVQRAYEKLKSVSDSNINTQYWLVVITDGDFNEIQAYTDEDKIDFLNENMSNYLGQSMPNNSMPQITFLAIGDKIASPDEDTGKGLYTFRAKDANEITSAMSNMADRISGRTRLKKEDIKQIDNKTIQVSSSIPLLNIAVFAQKTSAKVVGAVYDNEASIPITRSAQLNYPTDANDLLGSATLIGDSQKAIGSGDYRITFNQDVNLDDIVVLFEPALEMRVDITINGKKISSKAEIKNAEVGDKISATCKIYEMGTDNEVDSSLLPPETSFETSLSENGKITWHSEDASMQIKDYVLNDVDTELRAAVTIKGFNPIEYKVDFHPISKAKNYTITASYLNNSKSIKIDDISGNKDLAICFEIAEDGNLLKSKESVQALNPVISTSIQNNSGEISYTDAGKIIFTPNVASAPDGASGSYEVKVTCTLNDGTAESLSYTVLISDYQIIAINSNTPVAKTQFYNNKTGVYFYITKDGTRLTKNEVEKDIAISLNDTYKDFKTEIKIENDGTITVTPYIEDEHKLNFGNWWINWAYYFGLSGDDVNVTLNHPFGSAQAKIDVTGESVPYILLNVVLPMFIEVALLIIFIIWLILIIKKPRFTDNATLYVGNIRYNPTTGSHVIRDFSAVKLSKFNKIKRGNGRLEFKKKAKIVSANGIRIRADHGGRIICEMLFPWYKGKIHPVDIELKLSTPKDVCDYVEKKPRLEIAEFATTKTISGDFNRAISASNQRNPDYFVIPQNAGVTVIGDRKVIKEGKIIIYTN